MNPLRCEYGYMHEHAPDVIHAYLVVCTACDLLVQWNSYHQLWEAAPFVIEGW